MSITESDMGTSIDVRAAVTCALVLALTAIPALLDAHAVREAAALYPLADTGNPYWIPSRAPLLYVRAPVVVLSAFAMFLTSGLMLSIAAGMTRTVEIWILSSLLIAIVVVSAGAGFAQAAVAGPIGARPFAALVVALNVVAAAVAIWRVSRRKNIRTPWRGHGSQRSLAILVLLLYAAVVAFTPKIYWDSFNGDGAGAFEASRLLLTQSLPLWSDEAGRPWPALISMLFLYPGSWFMRLFGDVEASVRLPWILYLGVLFSVIRALAEHDTRRLGTTSSLLIVSGVSVYAMTMAFSATFSPYWADIAMPAVPDVLTSILFLAFVYFFVTRRTAWMVFAQILLFTSFPSGFMLTALWIAASFAIRPLRTRVTYQAAVTLVFCVVGAAAGARILQGLGYGAGGEYSSVYLIRSYSYIAVTHWDRILWAAVPAGILPFAALFAWRRHDPIGKALSLVAIVWFTLTYFRGYAAIHHFTPSMIIPMVVFWRLVARGEFQPRVANAMAFAGIAAAFVLSLPRNPFPHMESRRIGQAVENRIPGYERSAPEIIRSLPLFVHVFPYDWTIDVPRRSFGGSPLTWLYYGSRRPASAPAANYILQTPSAPAPEGTRLIAASATGALYLRSDSLHALHLATRPRSPGGSPTYDVPRDILFATAPEHRTTRVFSTRNLISRIGIDANAVIARMGLKK